MKVVRDNIAGNIFLRGDVSSAEMADLIVGCDAVMLPSLVEAVSLSVMEANACGKPVFASDAGGNVEFVEEGWNGYIFEKKSVTALVECIRAHIDECMDARMSLNCIAAAKPYTWKAVAARTDRVLERFSPK
jgi:hypothetical protein